MTVLMMMMIGDSEWWYAPLYKIIIIRESPSECTEYVYVHGHDILETVEWNIMTMMNDDDSDHEIAVGEDFVMEHNSADVASLNSQFMFSYTIY